MAAPVELLRRVPLFAELSEREVKRLAKSFKERTFPTGHEIAREGQSGVGFFVIGDGRVSYSVRGEKKGEGRPGDYFGEIALVDDGPRSATVTAETEVLAYGLTSWEFRPLVEENAAIAWQMLQVLAKRLRSAQQAQA